MPGSQMSQAIFEKSVDPIYTFCERIIKGCADN